MNTIAETRALVPKDEKKAPRPGVLREMQGVFSVSDKADKEANRNGRLYSESLLRERIVNSPYTQDMLSRGCLLGEADHPGDRLEISIKDVSHRVKSLDLKDGVIEGVVEILDTPVGRVVNTLLDAGVQLGISSRAAGTVVDEGKVQRVKESDYIFYTYDLVTSPGFSKALLYPVTESVQAITPSFKKAARAILDQVAEADILALPVMEQAIRNTGSDAFEDALLAIRGRLAPLAHESTPAPATSQAEAPITEGTDDLQAVNQALTEKVEILRQQSVSRTEADEDSRSRVFLAEQDLQVSNAYVASLAARLRDREAELEQVRRENRVIGEAFDMLSSRASAPAEIPAEATPDNTQAPVVETSSARVSELENKVGSLYEVLASRREEITNLRSLLAEQLSLRMGVSVGTVLKKLPEGVTREYLLQLVQRGTVAPPSAQPVTPSATPATPERRVAPVVDAPTRLRNPVSESSGAIDKEVSRLSGLVRSVGNSA